MSYNCPLCDKDFKLRLDVLRHLRTEKHLSHFNQQQRVLVVSLLDYVESKDINGVAGIRINSAGGTGKTFCAGGVFNYLKNVICLAPTNRAVAELRKHFPYAQTIHKFFGWATDVDENGKDVFFWKTPNIPPGTIFLIDEISMMTDAQYSLFHHYIYGKYQYVIMGDKAQLPPVETNEVESLPVDVPKIKNTQESLSLFFQFPATEVILTENMRTQDAELNALVSGMRENVLQDKYIHLENNWRFDCQFIKENIHRNFLIIAHKNDDVVRFNTQVRNYLHPEKQDSQVEVGDRIRINQYHIARNLDNGGTMNLMSGDIYSITQCSKETLTRKNIFDDSVVEFPCYRLVLNDMYVVYTIQREYQITLKLYKDHNKKLIKKVRSTAEKPMTDDEVKDAKKTYHRTLRARTSFDCGWKFAFASTVHKAQGASYDLVYVYNYPQKYFQGKNKYTACSRVVNELKIFKM